MGRPIPKKDYRVSRQEAHATTKRWRERQARSEPLPPMPPLAYHREALELVLAQPGCVAVRSYPALTEDGQATLLLVGVDADGNDLVDGALVERGEPCPPYCSDPNDLTA
jgi:hypothetical protein